MAYLITEGCGFVGSNLSAILLLSRRVQKLGALVNEPGEDLASINRIAQQTANAIREIVWLINPENDTAQDLVLRMKEAAPGLLAGIPCRFDGPAATTSRRLTLLFRQNFFLIYKEILTNVARHSGANHVRVMVAVEVKEIDVRPVLVKRIADIGPRRAHHVGTR